MFKEIKKAINWGGKEIELSTGKIARQASGSCVVRIGETVVLCTVVAEREAKPGASFFPLTVNYLERFYAVGSIPGGFFKRESKPSERETLTSRLIDRPLRPMFPEGFRNEVQIVCTVLSFDKTHESDIAALVGASAAIAISGIPFMEPVVGARIGYINGEYTLNPTIQEMEHSSLDLVLAGTESSILMVESEAKELSEEIMLGALDFGQKSLKPVLEMIAEFAKEVGNTPWVVPMHDESELVATIRGMIGEKMHAAFTIKEKLSRQEALKLLKEEVISALPDVDNNKVGFAFKLLEQNIVRTRILKNKDRIDGRALDQIRDINCEVDILPKVHGSALFTRGETQALVVTTLGTGNDGQMVDDISGNRTENFILHYNFPPYSVGEAGPMRAPGRREIGHGKLAYRSLKPVMPAFEDFPYVVRVVSEITESNGSSSMATVCGTSLALMSCGVALKAPVAGIAMGLVKEGDDYAVLSDIMGDEDYLGDMDFKVAGTSEGITALQMDIKINGISQAIMHTALEQAKVGRAHILAKMLEILSTARTTLNSNAPKIVTIQVEKDKIRELIGPGGKMIKSICEKSQAKIDIADDGTVRIAASNEEQSEIAIQMIRELTAVPEIGKIYIGIITKITDFGAFVRYIGNSEGLVHISEIVDHKLAKVTDVVSEAATVVVKLIGIERNGKVRLSMKGLNPEIAALSSATPQEKNDTKETVETKPATGEKSIHSEKAPNRKRNAKTSKPKTERAASDRRVDTSEEPSIDSSKKKRRLF